MDTPVKLSVTNTGDTEITEIIIKKNRQIIDLNGFGFGKLRFSVPAIAHNTINELRIGTQILPQETLTLNGNNLTAEIDGRNVLHKFTGEWLRLFSKENVFFEIIAEGNSTFSVILEYREMFL